MGDLRTNDPGGVLIAWVWTRVEAELYPYLNSCLMALQRPRKASAFSPLFGGGADTGSKLLNEYTA